MKSNILYNFISPVTGRVLADPNYALVGNKIGIAIPSPILIDIRLDIIELKRENSIAHAATYVIGEPNTELPNAQVLNKMANGFLYNTVGVISTHDIITLDHFPDLPKDNLFVGDENNRPIIKEKLAYVNLPDLEKGKLLIGNEDNRPEEKETISTDNLPDLEDGMVWVGDPQNRPILAPFPEPALTGAQTNKLIWDFLNSNVIINT